MRIEADVSTRRGLAWTFAGSGLALALLGYVALTGSDAHGHVSAITFAAGAVVVVALSFLALTRGWRQRRPVRRRVSADSRGLSLDGALVVPRHALLDARVREASDGTPTVRVTTKGFVPQQTIHVPSERIAQALVEELERAPIAIAEFQALPPWAHRMRWVAVGLTTSPWIILNLLRFMPPMTIAVVVGLYALLGLPTLLPRRVLIGEDGVLLRWAGQKRFVPFAGVLAAREAPLGIELDLADGETLEIRLGHRPDAQSRQRQEMLARIDDGMRAQRAIQPADDEALLARGRRPLDAWIAESDALGRDATAGYRTVAMPRERLWAVLENPGAEASAREGAAIALRAQLADDERERLARVVQRSASPRLRVTLEAVAAGTDAVELRGALEDELTADAHDQVRPRAS